MTWPKHPSATDTRDHSTASVTFWETDECPRRLAVPAHSTEPLRRYHDDDCMNDGDGDCKAWRMSGRGKHIGTRTSKSRYSRKLIKFYIKFLSSPFSALPSAGTFSSYYTLPISSVLCPVIPDAYRRVSVLI